MAGWFAAGISVIGAFLVANGIFMFYGFVAYTYGSVAWAYIGWRRKDLPLLAMNAIFILPDVNGLIHYWGK